MEARRVCWVTVNYLQEDFVAKWVDSIEAQNTNQSSDIFVVDNSSSIADFQSREDFLCLRPGENLGYFRGFNHFLQCVDSSQYQWIVFSNPDVEFNRNFITTLNSCSDVIGDVDVVAPRITTEDGEEQNPSAERKRSRLKRAIFDFRYSNYLIFRASFLVAKWLRGPASRNPNLDQREIYLCHGSCFVTRPEFFTDAKSLDDRVFLWGEEPLLKEQCERQGGRIIFLPDCEVTHASHSVTGKIPSKDKFRILRESYKVYREHI
ncbi:glycosyltransferase [Candidatus Marimicrobium litorale]|uniref:Glycosyltransferase family 2 protein n=1 Tax=Candidatus Marimicrobium litorale TaxID=2518991 RepID=A0ABT3T535_9GAMM|nr:glycosyltransferase family 2 protein [Candidatus Marimicrobium litorale]